MAVNPNFTAGGGGFDLFGAGGPWGSIIGGIAGGLFGGGGGLPKELITILNMMKANNELAVQVFNETNIEALVERAISTFGTAADKTARIAVQDVLAASDRQANVGSRDSRTDLAIGAATVPAGIAKAEFSARALLSIPGLKKLLLPGSAGLGGAVGAAGAIDASSAARGSAFSNILLDIGRLFDQDNA